LAYRASRHDVLAQETAMEPHASAWVSLGIPVLSLLTITAIRFGLYALPETGPRWARWFAFGALLWLVATALLARSGLLLRFDLRPPPMFGLFVAMLVIAISFSASRVGAALARDTPVAWLVGFHAFRLPLELVMHVAAREGIMPVQMTFTGANFDIVTGATALALAALCARRPVPRGVLIAWNLLGSLLLCVIVGIAIASLPSSHAFGTEPARVNTWVLYFPFVWLPAVLVNAALIGHLILWRKLLAREPLGLASAPA
jgi:hypothetical protein